MNSTLRLAVQTLVLAGMVNCNCQGLESIGGLPGSVEGTACDLASGLGGTGVEVAVDVPGAGSRRVTSAENGSFLLENIPPGEYEVLFSQGESIRPVTGVIVVSNQTTQVLDPACIAARNPPGTGWVRGHVCNRHTGGWVTEAEVSIPLPDGNVAQTTTDSEGRFLLERIPAGDHLLYIRGTGYQRTYAITVVDGRETVVDSPAQCQGFDPNSGAVEGTFCAPNGTGPLTSASVYVDVGNPPVRLSDMTDVDGHFLVTGIPPGHYALHVEKGAYHRVFPVDITAGNTTAVGGGVCPPPDDVANGRVTGMLCNPQAHGPLVGASVTIDVSGGSLEDTTDATGRFSFANVNPGNHTVDVQHVSLHASYPVVVVAGQTSTLVPVADCGGVSGPVGEIRGRMCAPNGTTWLANARVWVDTPVGTMEALTDSNGRFSIPGVPVGTYTVHVSAGSFTSDYANVEVRTGQVTYVGQSPDQCVPLQTTHRIAVVSGDYDDIEVVLRRLGLNQIDGFDGFTGAYRSDLLENYATMQLYDVIFFNCGLLDAFLEDNVGRQMAVDNLRQFVSSGRSIYASDWAYNLVEVAWPGAVDFLGDDTTLSSAKMGLAATLATGNVTSPALRNALGQQTVEISFNLDAWVVMSGVTTGTTVYIRGNADVCDDIYCLSTSPVSNVPYTVGFKPSSASGKVLFTSFHQEQQTTADMDRVLQLLVFEL